METLAFFHGYKIWSLDPPPPNFHVLRTHPLLVRPPYGSIGLLLKVFTMPLTTYSTQLNQTRPIDRRDLIDWLSINGLSLAAARHVV